MTIGQALQRVRQQLIAVSDAPDIDAQRLLLAVFDTAETSWLFAHSSTDLTSGQAAALAALASARATGKPLAYILGHAEFYGRDFLVTPDVLIPRPATEALVEKALTYIRQLSTQKGCPLAIADIGTGSGCIAITLALETGPAEAARIYATDISPAALAIARQNAKRHGMDDRITFLEGTMLEPIKDMKIDLIVSNPPYVPTDALNHSLASPTADNKGLQFEPRQALDGGNDGNDYINKLKESGIPLITEIQLGNIQIFNT